MEDNAIERIRWNRSDLSFFLVHLTKAHVHGDCRLDASGSLRSILKKDSSGDCVLYGSKGEELGLFSRVDSVKNKDILMSVCFTEAPLDQIKHFDKPLVTECGHDYSSYGLVFEQDFIRKKGGNPCFYINTMDGESLKKAILSLGDMMAAFEDYEGSPPNWSGDSPKYLSEQIRKILPFFNIYGPGGKKSNGEIRDFYWEREWRVPGTLRFKHKDIFCGLCSNEDVDTFSREYPDIPFISPEWSNDKIIRKLRDWP